LRRLPTLTPPSCAASYHTPARINQSAKDTWAITVHSVLPKRHFTWATREGVAAKKEKDKKKRTRSLCSAARLFETTAVSSASLGLSSAYNL
jgi:hypothetical protein